MKLYQLQEYCNEICDRHNHSHIPLLINKRFKRLFGRAHWGKNERIYLSDNLMCQPDEIQLSVLIHEICHILTKQGHTNRFFKLCDTIHETYGLKEIRRSKVHHGEVYSGDKKIQYNDLTETQKEAKKINISDIPD